MSCLAIPGLMAPALAAPPRGPAAKPPAGKVDSRRFAPAAPGSVAPATQAPPPAGGQPAADGQPNSGNEPTLSLQLVPTNPRLIGVVGVPGLAELLQKAGYQARVVGDQELDAGALDPFGLLLVSLERPFTVTAAAFLRDFVARGGAMCACSWGPAVAAARQAAFPVYRLQDALQIRVIGWDAAGRAYVRSANSGTLFRGLPEFVDVEHRATPLVETMPKGRVEAVWVEEEGSAGSRRDARYPAAVASQRSIYFASNVLAGALNSRQMLRFLANAIAVLNPGAAADGTRLPLAELEVTLAEARQAAATVRSEEATALLAQAEAKAATAIQLAAQPAPAAPAGTQTGDAGGAAPSLAAAPGAPAGANAATPQGVGTNPMALPDAETPPAPDATATPAPTPALPPTAVPAINQAIDLAERVSLLEVPSRPVEVRGVFLPRSAIPATRPAIAQLLESLRAAGINLVLPEVYSAGVTLSPGPNQDPRYVGADPLAALLAEAAPRGIAVYAWASVLSGGVPGAKGVLGARARWVAQTKAGARYVTGGIQWLCPSQVDVRDAVCEGIRRALAGYAVQGVYLSDVDFGGVAEACYDPTCVALFHGDYGRSPRAEPLRGEWQNTWLEWRRDRVTTLVRRVMRDVQTIRPGVPIYVGLSARALDLHNDCIADWRAWSRAGWVAGFCPEVDSGDDNVAESVAHRVPLLAPGAGVLPVVSTGRIHTARQAMDVIGAIQQENAAGILFDLPGPLIERWGTDLARGCFRVPARLAEK